jgi:hypothetical protein
MNALLRNLYFVDWGQIVAVTAMSVLTTMAVAVGTGCFWSIWHYGHTVMGLALMLAVDMVVSGVMTLTIDRGRKVFWYCLGGYSLESAIVLLICVL